MKKMAEYYILWALALLLYSLIPSGKGEQA